MSERRRWLAFYLLCAGEFMIVIDTTSGMLLLGVGCGMALNPVMLAAMSDVDPSESGLASGVVNTSFMVGGALGLAALASLAEVRGYHAAFAAGALFAAAAAAISFFLDSRTSEKFRRGCRFCGGRFVVEVEVPN